MLFSVFLSTHLLCHGYDCSWESDNITLVLQGKKHESIPSPKKNKNKNPLSAVLGKIVLLVRVKRRPWQETKRTNARNNVLMSNNSACHDFASKVQCHLRMFCAIYAVQWKVRVWRIFLVHDILFHHKVLSLQLGRKTTVETQRGHLVLKRLQFW